VSFKLRRRAAGAVSAALVALTLIGPGAVSAATPDLIATWTVIPTTVHDGDYVAFRGSIYNNDTSTVSQLFLVELTRDPNLTLLPTTVKWSKGPSQGSCDATTNPAQFVCTLGQLKPGKTATVTAVYRTADVDPPTAYTATGRWEFNTTGLGSESGGDNSHGDSWPSVDPTTLVDLLTVQVSSSGDFGGRYVLTSNDKIVENSQALSNANPHSTRAYAPVTEIGVTVEDIVIVCDGAPDDALCADLGAGFGQVSLVNVNDDVDDSGINSETLLHFYLQFDSSELPPGVNANNLTILHVFPGGFEEISTDCTYDKKSTTPNNDAPCIDVKSLPGGDLGVDVWTFHNGALRGNF